MLANKDDEVDRLENDAVYRSGRIASSEIQMFWILTIGVPLMLSIPWLLQPWMQDRDFDRVVALVVAALGLIFIYMPLVVGQSPIAGIRHMFGMWKAGAGHVLRSLYTK